MPNVQVNRKSSGAIKKRVAQYKALAQGGVKVGFPIGKQQAYPDGTELLTVAVVNEFGSRSKNDNEHVPERPFMRTAFAGQSNRRKLNKVKGSVAKRYLEGKISAKKAKNLLGEYGVGEIKTNIRNIRSPANDPKTIKRKGSSNPLVDTGHMRQSVTYEAT